MKYNKSIEDMLRLLDDIISDNDIPDWYPRDNYVTGELSEKEKIEFAFNTAMTVYRSEVTDKRIADVLTNQCLIDIIRVMGDRDAVCLVNSESFIDNYLSLELLEIHGSHMVFYGVNFVRIPFNSSASPNIRVYINKFRSLKYYIMTQKLNTDYWILSSMYFMDSTHMSNEFIIGRV